MSVPAQVVDRMIRFYQYVFAGRTSPCRHVPSCSTFAREAIETHGALRGSRLAIGRVVRCNPWGTEGFDPVPNRQETNV